MRMGFSRLEQENIYLQEEIKTHAS